MVNLDIFHKEEDRGQRYIDLHIPKRFEEKLYFLIGYKKDEGFEIRIDLVYWFVWYKDHELALFM